jgi:hypothetical protein
MKQLCVMILILTALYSFGQKIATTQKAHFKIIEYSGGSVYRSQLKTVDTIGLGGLKIDLYFFKKYFDVPSYLPDRLIDSRYKNRTIVLDPETYAEQTCTYDSLSRVVNYTHLACVTCSYMSFGYNFNYNGMGQLEKIEGSDTRKSLYKIYYDKKGNVRQLDCLSFGTLDKRIIRLK